MVPDLATPLLARRADVVAALVPATVVQGFAPEVARAGLAAEVAAWDPPVLTRLARELPPGAAARTPRAALVIAARTLPASALRQCLFVRALGAVVHLKCAAGQEALGEALHTLDPAIVPTPFVSDDAAASARAIAAVDTVVVLGSDATVAAVRALTPRDKGFAAHGHKVSAAWLASPTSADIEGLADDLLAWDQAGCLAPQVAWCDAPDTLGPRLLAALQTREADLPLATLALQRQARLHVVPEVIMRDGATWASATCTLATLPDATFRASPGPRMLWLLPADDAARASLGALAAGGHLSTVALPATSAPSIAGALTADVRTCAPGQMQRPPLDWHQDGLHPLASLLVPAAVTP